MKNFDNILKDAKIRFLPSLDNSHSFINKISKEQAQQIIDSQKNRAHLTGTPKTKHLFLLTEINGLQPEKSTYLQVNEPSKLYDQIIENINNPRLK